MRSESGKRSWLVRVEITAWPNGRIKDMEGLYVLDPRVADLMDRAGLGPEDRTVTFGQTGDLCTWTLAVIIDETDDGRAGRLVESLVCRAVESLLPGVPDGLPTAPRDRLSALLPGAVTATVRPWVL